MIRLHVKSSMGHDLPDNYSFTDPTKAEQVRLLHEQLGDTVTVEMEDNE